MTQATDDALEAGREALKRHAWQDASAWLREADKTAALTAEDLEGLAEAAWWTGRLRDCIAAKERAVTAYLERRNEADAGRVAVALAKDYFTKEEAAVGQAWLRRAEQLLATNTDSLGFGYLERLHALRAFDSTHDLEKGLEHARRALEIAARIGNRDLMALALHDQGWMLAKTGKLTEGNALMDEATVAAVAGELGPMATGIIYCNTIGTCVELADYRRAGEWTEAATRWCDRVANAGGFPGTCRVYRAGIMFLRGAWAEAEADVRRACQELLDFRPGFAAEGFYALGEIRLRLGDREGARDAFRQAHELGRDPLPGRSLLLLPEGKVEDALATITRGLGEATEPLARARLLPAQVEIMLSAGDADVARSAAVELETIAETFGTPALQASALTAQGGVELARGNAGEAQRAFRRAYKLWHELDAPYEAARARMRLAEAYQAGGDAASAAMEMEAAQTIFERLGAAPDLRRALGIVDALGQRATTRKGQRTDRAFMFTDIVRSTNLIDAIGDEPWEDLRRWHDQTLRALFARHRGQEADHAGDGFFVAFDDPAAALDCAVSIQQTLAEHRRTHGFAPQVRIG
ncbi:MAG: hypothetical protein ACRDHY_00325, partial [Anaerolineales bacterium]